MHDHRMYTLLLQKIIRKKDDTIHPPASVLCCQAAVSFHFSCFHLPSVALLFQFVFIFWQIWHWCHSNRSHSIAFGCLVLSWLCRISNYSGLYSALLQEARKVIKIIPEKDTMKNNIIPLALAVAKSVHNAPWTASTYKELMLGHDRAS